MKQYPAEKFVWLFAPPWLIIHPDLPMDPVRRGRIQSALALLYGWLPFAVFLVASMPTSWAFLETLVGHWPLGHHLLQSFPLMTQLGVMVVGTPIAWICTFWPLAFVVKVVYEISRLLRSVIRAITRRVRG